MDEPNTELRRTTLLGPNGQPLLDGRVNNGGAREDSGPKAGAKKPRKITKLTMLEKYRSQGELPHEFLLRVVRGEPINGEVQPVDVRIDAAKAAAPFFAPKLSSIELVENMSDDALVGVILQGLLNADFAALIEQHAAAAGIALSLPRIAAPQSGAGGDEGGGGAEREAEERATEVVDGELVAHGPNDEVREDLDAAGAVQGLVRREG